MEPAEQLIAGRRLRLHRGRAPAIPGTRTETPGVEVITRARRRYAAREVPMNIREYRQEKIAG